jgi:hypothetical protein
MIVGREVPSNWVENNINILLIMKNKISMTNRASARISKGQGYQGFARKRAGSSFGQKRAICVVQGKTDRISLLLLGSIKCFPFKFLTHLRHFRWLPYGAGQ